MADARPRGPPRRLSGELPQADARRRRAVCAIRGLERRDLLRDDTPLYCRVRNVLRTFWSEWTARSYQYPDRSTTGLLLPVALRGFVSAPAIARNARVADRARYRIDCLAGSPVCLGRRREELEAASHRGSDHPAGGCGVRYVHTSGRPCALESGDGCLEQRAGSHQFPERTHGARAAGSAPG